MRCNENWNDRIFRLVLGVAVFAVAYFAVTDWLQIALYLVGSILVVTGLTGFCIIYEMLGISSLKKSKRKPE